MDRTIAHPKWSWARLWPYLQLRPYTGKLGLDLAFLLLLGALHHTVLPSLVGRFMLVDLMTPWLVTTLVAARFAHGAALAIAGALILETHSAAPAGLYVTAYWVIGAVLNLTRSTLSWRHAFPWAVTFVVAQLWIISFESFVIAVNEGGFRFDLRYGLVQTTRLIASLAFGMLLSRRFLREGVHEETA